METLFKNDKSTLVTMGNGNHTVHLDIVEQTVW